MIVIGKIMRCEVIEGELVKVNYYGLQGRKITPVIIYRVTERDCILSRDNSYYLIWGVRFYELPKEIKVKRFLFVSTSTTAYRV